MRVIGRRTLALGRTVPVTLGLLVGLWAVGALTGSLLRGPSATLIPLVAAGVRSLENAHLWTPLTAATFARGLPGYLVGTLVVLALGVPAERRLGSRRFALSALLTQVLGVLLALGVVRLIVLADPGWARELSRNPAVGPTTYAVGVAMVASAAMDTLWRRRLRVGMFVVLVTVMLYGGLLEDVVRFSCAVIGLLLGPVLLGRPRRGMRLTGTRREGRVLVAIVVAASALGPVLAAFSTSAVGPLSVLHLLFTSAPPDAASVQDTCASPATTAQECNHLQTLLRLSGVGPSILSVLPSLLLVVLSDGLRRGRRAAWAGAVAMHVLLVVLSVFLLLHATVGLTGRVVLTNSLQHVRFVQSITIPLVAPLVVLALLVTCRRLFDVDAPRRTYRRLAVTASGLVATLAVVYLLGGLALGGGFDRRPGLLNLVRDFPQRFVPPGYLGALTPEFLPESVPATVLFEWTGVVFWVVLSVLAIRSFLRPVTADDSSAGRALALLRLHGGTNLSWMTTWAGNRRWFTAEGDGFVAYRVLLGVAVTTSDPVCPPGRTAAVVLAFADFSTANGWTPCFYSVTERVRAATAALGWEELQVAEETVLPLGALTFTGKKFQDVRSSLNKATKDGITATWLTYPTAAPALTAQIVAISQEWVIDRGTPEMGFTLGGLAEVDDLAVRCLVAVDGDGTVHGVTSWLPVHRDGVVVGWTLDFMRRRRDGFRPAMEFLIASAALLLQEEGAEFISLSGAPLAKVARPGADGAAAAPDSIVQRLLDVLGRGLEPVYGFRSLLAFKSKFQPEHVPLYMTYPDVATLPAIGNAIGRAYLPQVSLSQGVTLVVKLVSART